MIKDSFTYYCNANGINADAIFARLQDKAKERKDREAWVTLIEWKLQQPVFTVVDVAEMLGMKYGTVKFRFDQYR